MAPNLIRDHLRKQPFSPIRLFMSDGAHYDVRHPEMAYVGLMDLVVALGATQDGIPTQSAYLDPRHVTRIEPINGHTKKSSKPKRRGK